MINKPLYLLGAINDKGHPFVLLESSLNRVNLEKKGEMLWKNYCILTDVISARTIRGKLLLVLDKVMMGVNELPECVLGHYTTQHHIRRVKCLVDDMYEGWWEECDTSLVKEIKSLKDISYNHYRAHEYLIDAYIIANDIWDMNRGLEV